MALPGFSSQPVSTRRSSTAGYVVRQSRPARRNAVVLQSACCTETDCGHLDKSSCSICCPEGKMAECYCGWEGPFKRVPRCRCK
jgi:hypothetical protein